MTSTCKTVFLDEETAPDFAPHRRVVDSLANLIATTRGGRVLSLVGPYGSGKTTILHRLQSAFAEERPRARHLFLFDAWAHRGEVLRRAFIVKLTGFLADEGLLTPDDRKLVEKQMTRMPDVSSSTTSPKYVLVAGLFAVLGMLVSPALTLIGRSGQPFTVSLYAAAALFIGLFAGATFLGRTVSVTETRRASDLTSLEFQSAFTTAINRALLRRPDATLVIAFDDLDRIPAKDVSEVITALRIFLAAEKEIGDFRRLWFLVPFDREAMKETMGEHALEKIFALRMDVPPPNLPTSLRTFATRFLQAFPQHTIFEAQEVHSMFGQVRTFRELNSFLNRVAVLHASWCGQIPIADLAAYVLSEDLSSNVRPGGTADHAAWLRRVAALEYNVPEEEVEYLVDNREFEEALKRGNAAPLRAMMQSPSFAQTVYRVVRSIGYNTPAELMNAAVALSEIDAGAQLDEAWQELLVTAKSVDEWPAGEDMRGVELLLARARPEDRKLMIRVAMRSILRGLGHQKDGKWERWLANYDSLMKAVGEEIPAAALTPIGGTPRFRLEVLRLIDEGRIFFPVQPPIELHDHLTLSKFAVEMALSEEFEDRRRTLELLLELGRDWDWSPALKIAAERIRENPSQVIELLVMVEELARRPEATAWLDQFARDGVFLAFAVDAWPTLKTPAMMLATLSMRQESTISNTVYVPGVNDDRRRSASDLAEFLMRPVENPRLLSEVESVFRRRLVAPPDAALRLIRLGTHLGFLGGIHLEARPDPK